MSFHYSVPSMTDSSVYLKGVSFTRACKIHCAQLTKANLLQKPTDMKQISKNGCGYAKGCVTSPANCEPGISCDKVLTYALVGDSVKFELSVKKPNSNATDFYGAVGFSATGTMVSARKASHSF